MSEEMSSSRNTSYRDSLLVTNVCVCSFLYLFILMDEYIKIKGRKIDKPSHSNPERFPNDSDRDGDVSTPILCLIWHLTPVSRRRERQS